MPLLKRKPVPLIPLPPNVDQLAPDTQVFFLKATGEIFLEYDQYANRLSYLLCRIFQCEHNGKGNLDYFAALEEEKKDAKEVHSKFPDALKGRVLASVQFQVMGRLDALVDEIFERYKDRFFTNERVFVDCQGDKYYARISKVFPPSSIRALKLAQPIVKAEPPPSPLSSLSGSPPPPASNDPDNYEPYIHRIGMDLNIGGDVAKRDDDPDEYLYTVQVVDDVNRFEGSFMEVKSKSLSRDRMSFSKTILKRYIRECVTRDPLIASPWVVKTVFAQQYGISMAQSEEEADRNRLVREGKLAKRRKLPRDEDQTVAAAAGPAAKKKKLSMGVKEETPTLPSSVTKPIVKVPEPPKKQIKYPIEDLDLDPMSIHDGRILRRVNSELPPLPPKPAPSRELLVPKELWESFLGTWNMLNIFSKPLSLSTFTLDDFAGALRHTTLEPRCILLSELHACLTNIISSDQSRVLGSTGAPPKPVPAEPEEGAEGAEGSSESMDEEDEFDALLRKGISYAKRWDRTAKLKASEGREGWERHMIGALCQRGGPIHLPTLPKILKHLFSSPDGMRVELEISPPPAKGRPPNVKEKDKDSRASSGSAGTAVVPETEDGEDEEEKENGAEEDEEEKDELEVDELEEDDGADVTAGDIGEVDDGGADPERQYLSLDLEDKLEILGYLVTLALGSKLVRNYIEDSESQLTEYRKQRAEVNKERKALLEAKAIMDGKPVKVEGEDVAAPLSVPAPVEANGSATGFNGHASTSKGSAGPSSTPARLAVTKSAPSSAAPTEDDEVDDEEEDQLASSDGDNSDSGGDSAPDAPMIGAAITSRRLALEEKRLERQAMEISRSIELTKMREEAKLKNAGRREADKARADLEDATAKNSKRDDLVEREFRRYQGVARVRPLGKDRFYNRYWWLDGIGGMNLIGQGNGILYGTGRLFVQGPTEEDWAMACNHVGGSEEMEERRRREDVDPLATLEMNEWSFYEEEEEFDNLQSWLNSKGVRELALKNALAKWRPYILAGARRRQTDATKPFQPVDARRSTRSKIDPDTSTAHYLGWTNKLAKA